MLAKPSLSSRPLRASLSSRSTAIFAVVAVVALGSTVAATGLGRAPEGRFRDARARMNAECMDLAASGERTPAGSARRAPGNPCDLGSAPAGAIAAYKLGQRELEGADVAHARGDRAGAAARLAGVLERADTIDRSHTLAASVIAGKLIDGVASRVDRDSSLLDDARLASAIRRTSFASARHPMEPERLHALAVLAGIPAQVPLRSAGLVEATATQAMTDVDGTLHEMQAALLVKDVDRCEKAAERASGLAAQVTIGGGVCRIAVGIVQSGERLDGLRARAAARAPRVHTTTARRL
jgi:hypothetical protein